VNIVVGGVTDKLTEFITASKKNVSHARPLDIAELKRALFTIGLITKHFDFANVVETTQTNRVCTFLYIYCFN